MRAILADPRIGASSAAGGRPGTTFSVVTGLMKSLVTSRFREKSASMPCGLNRPSAGDVGRVLGDEVQVLVELHDAAARPAARRPHVGDEKPAAGERRESRR